MAQTKVKLISDGVIDVGHLASGHGITTDNIGEGSNLYYTDARVSTYLSTNNYATESYVTTAVANLVDSAPTTLDTLNELAAALGDDPNFATTVTNSIATKLPLAGGNITGTLGIGAATQVRKLHVDGGSIATDTPTIRISSTDSSGVNKFGIEFYSNNGADVRGKILADNNGRVYIDDNGGGGVVLQANGGSGNVGIGTSSPTELLDINGSFKWNGIAKLTDSAYFVGSPNYGFRFNDSTDYYNNVVFYDNGNAYFRGNVGIGANTSAWNLGKTLQLDGDNAAIAFAGTAGILGIVNGYFNGSSYKKIVNGTSASFEYGLAVPDAFAWRTEGTNTAGSSMDLSPKMVFTNLGRLGIATSTPQTSLHNVGSFYTSGRGAIPTGKGLEIFYYDPADAAYIESYDYANSVYKPTYYIAGTHAFLGGNVGIGTTAPYSNLTLNYTGDNLAGTYYGNLVLNATNNSTWSRIRLDRAGNSRFGIGLNPDDKFIISNLNVSGTGGADDTAFVITNTSKVGIGTANPTEKLTVNGSIGLEISGNVEFHIGYYNGGLNFSETNVADYRLFIKDGGNVGIGTSSPGEKLEVAGVTKSNSFEAKAFASIAAGTPYTSGIPYGLSKVDISSPCDNNWRTILSNVDYNKTIMWVTLGDAPSKDMATYFISTTFPAYGVAAFSATEYVDGGWNTGGFEFTLSGSGSNYSILVRATSYYNSANTATGNIYFLRLQ